MAQRKTTNAPRGSAADNLALMALCRHSGLSTGKLAEALEKDYGLTLSSDALGALLRRPDIRLYRLEQRRQAVAAAERFAETWARAAGGDEAARADLTAQPEAEAAYFWTKAASPLRRASSPGTRRPRAAASV